MKSIERVRRTLWTYKQPLTQEPDARDAAVSDLFVWRNSDEWQTFFELTDICGLFVDPSTLPPRRAVFLFFDATGSLFGEQEIDVVPNERRTIDLSAFTASSDRPFGTFCVFHSHTPQAVSGLGSFIAERGYIGYRYKNAPMRSYVHGNLDAVARGPDRQLQMLGVRSLRRREYHMQHELTGPAVYELMIVNPTAHNQSFSCRVLSSSSNALLTTHEAKLPPFGCHAFRIRNDPAQTSRVVIESHLVMARPVVFRIHDRTADVFHG